MSQRISRLEQQRRDERQVGVTSCQTSIDILSQRSSQHEKESEDERQQAPIGQQHPAAGGRAQRRNEGAGDDRGREGSGKSGEWKLSEQERQAEDRTLPLRTRLRQARNGSFREKSHLWAPKEDSMLQSVAQQVTHTPTPRPTPTPTPTPTPRPRTPRPASEPHPRSTLRRMARPWFLKAIEMQRKLKFSLETTRQQSPPRPPSQLASALKRPLLLSHSQQLKRHGARDAETAVLPALEYCQREIQVPRGRGVGNGAAAQDWSSMVQEERGYVRRDGGRRGGGVGSDVFVHRLQACDGPSLAVSKGHSSGPPQGQ